MACAWGLTLLVHMAIADKVDAINLPTYLFVFITPLLLFYLTSTITCLLPVDRRILAKLLITPRPPGLRGGGLDASRRALAGVAPGIGHCAHKTRDMSSVFVALLKHKNAKSSGRLTSSPSFGPPSGLVVVSSPAYRSAIKWLHALCRPCQAVRVALQANGRLACSNNIRFNSDSFAVGVNNHASRCMGNDKQLFDNLILARTSQRIGGISKGLAIKGKNTLVINIKDNTGKPHRIKIPNSLYLPGLKMCLLSPQH